MSPFVEHTIHAVIKNNNRQKYPKLVRQNQAALVQRITNDPKLGLKYKELYNNREYYTKKLALFLEELVDEVPNDDYQGPEDALTIANRYHALEYCRHRLSALRRKLIREKMLSHWDLQQTWHSQRQQVCDDGQREIAELEERLSNCGLGSLCGKMKLAGFRDQQLTLKRKQLKDKLDRFDEDVLAQCTKLADANAEFLRESRIPFFCLQPAYAYPDLDDDKAWMIQQLQQLLSDPPTTTT